MKDLLRRGWPGELVANPLDPATLHCDVPNTFAWSRANLAEAMPGVLTPLSWEFVAPSTVTVARSMFAMLGVVSPRELTAPLANAAEAASTLFYGRAALNVDVMRRYVARVPGADPDAFEQEVLGRSRGASPEAKQRWRLPMVAGKLPLNLARLRSQTERNRVETEAWWKAQIASLPKASLADAVSTWDDAVRRHVDLVAVHSFGIIIGQSHYSSLAALCASRGLGGLELDLSGSGEGTVETVIVDDVARLAAGDFDLDEFLAVHGFRGPDEGELASPSWREDPTPIVQLVELYRRGDVQRVGVARVRHDAARAQLLYVVPVWWRPLARWLVATVNRYMKLREVGKATFVRARDVGRAAARRIGVLLVERGVLLDADDVFFLTRAELDGAAGAVLRERVAVRRALRARYEAIDIADHFTGVPQPIEQVRATCATAGDVLRGVPAGGGTFEGIARVLRSPDDYDGLADVEVLVCELTDPAWAPLLQLAGAVVIDIGGALSHGAIVARELGIPAVIGTVDGTDRIPSGARVRVDGTAGTVELLWVPEPEEPCLVLRT